MIRHGKTTRGASTLLTEHDVRGIRARRKEGEAVKALATDYGVSQSTIKAIIVGRNWAWVTS